MKMKETSRGKDKELCVNNNLFLNPDRISLPDYTNIVEPIRNDGC